MLIILMRTTVALVLVVQVANQRAGNHRGVAIKTKDPPKNRHPRSNSSSNGRQTSSKANNGPINNSNGPISNSKDARSTNQISNNSTTTTAHNNTIKVDHKTNGQRS